MGTRYDEVALQVLCIHGGRVDVPADAEVQGQLAGQTQVILSEDANELYPRVGHVEELIAMGTGESAHQPISNSGAVGARAGIVAGGIKLPARIVLRVEAACLNGLYGETHLPIVPAFNQRERVIELVNVGNSAQALGHPARVSSAQEPADIHIGDAAGIRKSGDIAVRDSQCIVDRKSVV